jgi:hypothetical protein
MKAHVCEPIGPRLFALCIAVIFLFSTSIPQLPAQSAVKAAAPHSIEAQVRAVGIGHKAVVTKVDGNQLKGKIAAIDANAFSLSQGSHKGDLLLDFSDVSAVKKGGLPKGTKIAIGVGIGVGAAVGIFAAAYCSNGGFC